MVLSARKEAKTRELAEQLKAEGHTVDMLHVNADLAVNIGGAMAAAQAAAPKMLLRAAASP